MGVLLGSKVDGFVVSEKKVVHAWFIYLKKLIFTLRFRTTSPSLVAAAPGTPTTMIACRT